MPVLLLGLTMLVLLGSPGSSHAEPGPVKVFVLAGQSNVNGFAHTRTLDWLGQDEAFGHLLAKIRDPDGTWIERDDVWIAYPRRGRAGNLAIGYGNDVDRVGPELMFGHILGDHFDEQVLVVKSARSGASLYRAFRSPGAGEPSAQVVAGLLKTRQRRDPKATAADVKARFGFAYRELLTDVSDVLNDLEAHFPAYAGQGYTLAGFVWLHGVNDLAVPQYRNEYATNLSHLIRDVRREWKTPDLPVVIGELGLRGDSASDEIKAFRKTQASVAARHEWKGTVAFALTAKYWEDDLRDLVSALTDVDERTLEEIAKRASDYPIHYWGSGRMISLIGYGLAKSMIALVERGP